MRKVLISGGPHTGKSTLIKALKSEFSNAYFVPEPAETVIIRELAKQALDKSYIPKVPWLDYSTFGPVVADESVMLEAKIPDNTKLVFQDRSLIDTVGYCRLNDLESFIPEVEKRILAARYSLALFCEPVGRYRTTEVRRETEDKARLTHDILAEAYDQSGIDVVHLPAVSVAARVRLVHTSLG
jgi:predicted ATPase